MSHVVSLQLVDPFKVIPKESCVESVTYLRVGEGNITFLVRVTFGDRRYCAGKRPTWHPPLRYCLEALDLREARPCFINETSHLPNGMSCICHHEEMRVPPPSLFLLTTLSEMSSSANR